MQLNLSITLKVFTKNSNKIFLHFLKYIFRSYLSNRYKSCLLLNLFSSSSQKTSTLSVFKILNLITNTKSLFLYRKASFLDEFINIPKLKFFSSNLCKIQNNYCFIKFKNFIWNKQKFFLIIKKIIRPDLLNFSQFEYCFEQWGFYKSTYFYKRLHQLH